MNKKYIKSKGMFFSNVIPTSSECNNEFKLFVNFTGISFIDMVKKFICSYNSTNINILGLTYNHTNEPNVFKLRLSDSSVYENCVIKLTGSYNEDILLRIISKKNGEYICEPYDLDQEFDDTYNKDNEAIGFAKRASMGWELVVDGDIYDNDEWYVIRPKSSYNNGTHHIVFRLVNRALNGDDEVLKLVFRKGEIPDDIYKYNSSFMKLNNYNLKKRISNDEYYNFKTYNNRDFIVVYQLWDYDKTKTIEENLNLYEIPPSKEIKKVDEIEYDGSSSVKYCYVTSRYLIPNCIFYPRYNSYDNRDWILFGDDQFFVFSVSAYNRIDNNVTSNIVSFGYLEDISTKRMRFFSFAPTAGCNYYDVDNNTFCFGSTKFNNYSFISGYCRIENYDDPKTIDTIYTFDFVYDNNTNTNTNTNTIVRMTCIDSTSLASPIFKMPFYKTDISCGVMNKAFVKYNLKNKIYLCSSIRIENNTTYVWYPLVLNFRGE